jgi:hypothetical protein
MRKLFWLIGLLWLASSPANAQAPGNVLQKPLEQGTEQLKGKSASELSGVTGYTVAPGIIVTPSGYAEVGHDSNPDESFDQIGSPYQEVGTTLSVTAIGSRAAGNVRASGSWLQLHDEMLREDRWKAAIEANGVYSIAPGLSVSAGALLSQDETEFFKNRVKGAYAEINYSDRWITSFMRANAIEVRYLNDPEIPDSADDSLKPLFLRENLDVRSTGVTAGLLLGNNYWLAPYVEVGAANLDYFNQKDESLVDRDADDFHAKGGVRVTFSPALQADFGMRWNRRDLEDARFSDFQSSYFDFALRWTPWRYFSLTANIDRTIEEPSGLRGVLADTKTYGLRANYKPTDRIRLSVWGEYKDIEELGETLEYDARRGGAELSYDLTRSIQLYAGALIEYVEEEVSDADYNRLRVGAGARVVLGEQASIDESAKGVALTDDRTHVVNLPKGDLEISAGYSWLVMPEMHMTTVIGGEFFDEALYQLEDHDGRLNGFRTDVALRDVAVHSFESGHWMSFSFAGFYSFNEGTDHSACDFTATTDCVFVNIVDFDPDGENNTGLFGRLRTTTERDVRYWGVSVAGQPGTQTRGSLKDTAPVKSKSPFKFGLAFKALQERKDLLSIDISVPDPVDYGEDLDTYYYGGFVGIDHAVALAPNWALRLDAEAGLYLSDTSYEGRYVGFVPIDGSEFILEKGSLNLDDRDHAFIGSARLELQRALSWGTLSLYGEAEYLSHVPRIAYNNDDEGFESDGDRGSSPFGVIGTQVGTEIDSGEAYNFSTGIRLTVPLR